MEGEESGSESHWDVVGFKEKSSGGGMETGNQLFGLLFWLCMQRDWTLNVCVQAAQREKETKKAQKRAGALDWADAKIEVTSSGTFQSSRCDANQILSNR